MALASAITARSPRLSDALRESARGELEGATLAAVADDAVAAASLMAMDNVFYRFRHLIGNTDYESKPARLRMNRLVKPAGSKVDFELVCLAVSAINNCPACVIAHEHTVLEGGLTPDHVHDAVRIAAVVNAAAVGLAAVPAPISAGSAALP